MDELTKAMLQMLRFHSQMFYHILMAFRDTQDSPSKRKSLAQDIRRLTELVRELQEQVDKCRKGGVA